MVTMAVKQKRKNSKIIVRKVGARLGAEISNVDLSKPISSADLLTIQRVFVKHEVIIFRDQELTQEEYIAFGKQFGELTVHPFATSMPDHPDLIVLDNDGNNPPLSTDQWHSDEITSMPASCKI